MLCGGAGECGACCSCMLSSVKPLTALCLAAESCVRCGDGRCHGKRISAGTPTRLCFVSRRSSSSKPASRHSRLRGPQAITLSDRMPLPTDLLLSVPVVLAAWRAVCTSTSTSSRPVQGRSCPVQLQSCHIGCLHRTGAACTMSSVMQHARAVS